MNNLKELEAKLSSIENDLYSYNDEHNRLSDETIQVAVDILLDKIQNDYYDHRIELNSLIFSEPNSREETVTLNLRTSFREKRPFEILRIEISSYFSSLSKTKDLKRAVFVGELSKILLENPNLVNEINLSNADTIQKIDNLKNDPKRIELEKERKETLSKIKELNKSLRLEELKNGKYFEDGIIFGPDNLLVTFLKVKNITKSGKSVDVQYTHRDKLYERRMRINWINHFL